MSKQLVVDGQRLLSVPQAARYLGTTEAGIRSMIQRGELDSCKVKMGRSVRLDLEKLDLWIEAKSKATSN